MERSYSVHRVPCGKLFTAEGGCESLEASGAEASADSFSLSGDVGGGRFETGCRRDWGGGGGRRAAGFLSSLLVKMTSKAGDLG